MKEYYISFPGGWCYIIADRVVINKTTGQTIFYVGEMIVGIIRLDNRGVLVTGYDECEMQKSMNYSLRDDVISRPFWKKFLNIQ